MSYNNNWLHQLSETYKSGQQEKPQGINPDHIDDEGHYIVYEHPGHRGMKPINSIIGPYGSKEDGFYDHGEDVTNHHTGKELKGLLAQGHYSKHELSAP